MIDVETVRRLERRTLAEQAADELRNLILLEKLKPGENIPERETADALGVSRTPLREALRLLAAEGLVEVEPLRPPRVANPSLEELKQLLQVQGALEGLAGELTCEMASDQELRNIADIEAQMRELSDQPDALKFFECDMKFHRAIVEAAHNPRLYETHATYNARLWRARFISSRQRFNRERTLSEHRQILEAVLAREPQKASKALRKHLTTTYANIRQVFALAGCEDQKDRAS
jgi:DNA-binding GntR family transcriptional regulator